MSPGVRVHRLPDLQVKLDLPPLLLHLGVKDGVLARDEWGTDILDELTPEDDDTVFYKTRFSGFYRTELDELLKGSRMKHLIRGTKLQTVSTLAVERSTANPSKPFTKSNQTGRTRRSAWAATAA